MYILLLLSVVIIIILSDDYWGTSCQQMERPNHMQHSGILRRSEPPSYDYEPILYHV
jgi:hypothetical protein